jgi:hypothetical protein
MREPSGSCLDDDLADRFVHGRVTRPDEPDAIRHHMARCGSCRRLVSELAKRVTQPLVPVTRQGT